MAFLTVWGRGGRLKLCRATSLVRRGLGLLAVGVKAGSFEGRGSRRICLRNALWAWNRFGRLGRNQVMLVLRDRSEFLCEQFR